MNYHVTIVDGVDALVHLAATHDDDTFVCDKEGGSVFLLCGNMPSVRLVRISDKSVTCLECIVRAL